jgi:CubicO group peptidase (beta-lactamase class C family)
MERWLENAIGYLPMWLEYQMQVSRQPGLLLAVVHDGKLVLERAWGSANLATGEALTPRHRFRIASHSKSFTAGGIMKLREQRRLRLDDEVGEYVNGLHRRVAGATIAQVLSHSAGLVRDGGDDGFFADRRPFPAADQLLSDLARPPVIEAGLRLKYSNHGFGLLGLVIAKVTGEDYRTWIEREVVAAAGLTETTADGPPRRGTPFARGHGTDQPLGRRLVIPGEWRAEAIAPAGGFVSTAADTARYFNQLSPKARRSILSQASRREMVRRQWRNPHASIESHYGLGIMSGTTNGWTWFGHGGGLLGYLSRTATLPDRGVTLSLMSNSADGYAAFWLEGAINVLRTFAANGSPTRRVNGWTGRWWTAVAPLDLVPMGRKVLVAWPGIGNHPFIDASEVEVSGRDKGRIAAAGGYASYGEPVRRVRNKAGRVTEVWLGAARFVPKAKVSRELARRYRAAKA